ncbi:3-isopropylmalate dehydratase large subunit, chloroplastic-like [Tasmannia lanceolata]|uniref:3-isopropylmalate dehydratase large subunit, chloroplastic-like n=1 Tax=Tasmannia lanceolata TaxID=3420 RepID=UPI0040639DD5
MKIFHRFFIPSPPMASSTISSTPFIKKKEIGLSSSFSSPNCTQKWRKRGSKVVMSVMAPVQPQRAPSTSGSVKHAMTMTEKILARASERSKLDPGENVWVNVDVLLTHDVCGPGTIGIFKNEFGHNAKVWDREKIVIIPDHYIFTIDERANRNVDILRDFCMEQNIKYFYDIKDLLKFKIWLTQIIKVYVILLLPKKAIVDRGRIQRLLGNKGLVFEPKPNATNNPLPGHANPAAAVNVITIGDPNFDPLTLICALEPTFERLGQILLKKKKIQTVKMF